MCGDWCVILDPSIFTGRYCLLLDATTYGHHISLECFTGNNGGMTAPIPQPPGCTSKHRVVTSGWRNVVKPSFSPNLWGHPIYPWISLEIVMPMRQIPTLSVCPLWVQTSVKLVCDPHPIILSTALIEILDTLLTLRDCFLQWISPPCCRFTFRLGPLPIFSSQTSPLDPILQPCSNWKAPDTLQL